MKCKLISDPDSAWVTALITALAGPFFNRINQRLVLIRANFPLELLDQTPKDKIEFWTVFCAQHPHWVLTILKAAMDNYPGNDEFKLLSQTIPATIRYAPEPPKVTGWDPAALILAKLYDDGVPTALLLRAGISITTVDTSPRTALAFWTKFCQDHAGKVTVILQAASRQDSRNEALSRLLQERGQ